MSAPRPCAYCGAAVNIRCCEYGREWMTTHAEACPVVAARAGLLALETMAPDVQRAAAAEYEFGGDQEVELCTCGAAKPMATMGAAEVHVCPRCRGVNTRRSTAYWQCLSCDHEWQDAPIGALRADERWAAEVVDHATTDARLDAMECEALNATERVRQVRGHGINE